MAFLWAGPSTSIAGPDGRLHDRDERERQRVMTPTVLAGPIGDQCPDCATLKHAIPRGIATPPDHAEHRTHGSVGSGDVFQNGATTMNETNKPSELLSAIADAITNNPAGIPRCSPNTLTTEPAIAAAVHSAANAASPPRTASGAPPPHSPRNAATSLTALS